MYFFGQNFIGAVLVAVALIFSIILHELGHGYVALWCGDPTAKYNGRLTLNPFKHLDLLGTLMLITVGFGYAKPVPVNPSNFRHRNRDCFLVAIAGVTVNLVLSFLSCGIYRLCMLGYTATQGFGSTILYYLAYMFQYMSLCNLFLMFFNLLPFSPLDGFRVVESFTRFSNSFTKFLRNYGVYFLIFLFGASFIVDVFSLPVYFDLLGMYLNVTAGNLFNVFNMFWGLFL